MAFTNGFIIMTPYELSQHIEQQLASSPDLYRQLNNLRDWMNQNLPEFELYLEDVWNEKVPGETHFEYILRSKKTYNESDVLGYDVYKNHQDAKGVWHLDEYVKTVRLLETPEPLVQFIQENQ